MKNPARRAVSFLTTVAVICIVCIAMTFMGCSGGTGASASSKPAVNLKTDNYELDASWECRGATLHYPSDWTIKVLNEKTAGIQLSTPFLGFARMQWAGEFRQKEQEGNYQPNELVDARAKKFAGQYEDIFKGLKVGDNYTINSEAFDGKSGKITAIAPVSGRITHENGNKSDIRGFYWYGLYINGERYASQYICLFEVNEKDYDEHGGDMKAIIDAIEVSEDPDYDYDMLKQSGSSSTSASAATNNSSGSTTSASTSSAQTSSTKSYSAGTYRVGTDCPAGEYKLTASGHGYFCVYPDTSKGDILENSNFDKCQYITVSDGQCLEVKDATFVSREDAKPASGTISGQGRYLVGFDCPAGEYKLTQNGGSKGYYCINDNSTVDAAILQNNNFDGNDFCSVSEGQYLELSRCTAELA